MGQRVPPDGGGLDSTLTGQSPAAAPRDLATDTTTPAGLRRSPVGGRVDDPMAPTAPGDSGPSGEGGFTEKDEPDDRSGQVIAGRYRLRGLLGKGGMGAVYEAEQIDLGRLVAVKMLRAEGSGSERSELIGRFEREARLAAAIGHENIISIHDVGRTPQGEPFMVMERLDGMSLEALLAEDLPVSRRRLAAITDQVLSALQAAHAKGIVHRDIKPENVFICPGNGATDRVKVLDFGVSKILEPVAGLEKLRLTRTGTLLGTPLYMSPEQAAGDTALDLRVDLYAVGVILYRALSGEYPYHGVNFNALMAALLTRLPVPIGERVPGLHASWAELVGRAMARDRTDRFQSAEEMRAALRSLPAAALEGETMRGGPLPASGPAGLLPIDARAPRSGGSGSGPGVETTAPRQRPFPLAAAALGGLLVLGGAAFFLLSGGGERPAARADAGPAPTASAAAAAVQPDAAAPPAADLTTAAAPPTPPPAATAAEPPARPALIRVRVQVRPDDATIEIDGKRYTGSVDAQLPRDESAQLEIIASARRHRSRTLVRGRGADIDERIELEPVARPTRRGPSTRLRTVLE